MPSSSPRAEPEARGSREACSTRFRMWRPMSRSSRWARADSPDAAARDRSSLRSARTSAGTATDLVVPRGVRGADLLHCPTFRAPLRRPGLPVVATVHDLAVLREPGWFPAWSRAYGRHLMPRAIRLADRVVCVSRATARDASGLLGVSDSRIRVVPNGVDAVFSEPAAREPVSGPYILFVGTPEPRKNLPRIAGAFARLVREGRPERLVLAGADGWGGVELPARDRIVQLGRVDDATLRDLYAHARCVAYPSLWEGFGLVAGEALAAGCPVVCSDLPALREVAGSDAIYCDPLSVDSIADALRAALEGQRPSPRRPLTWESAARALVDVWRELVP